MAWRSSGSTNKELVENLLRFGVFSSKRVADAMKLVDRGYYAPRDYHDKSKFGHDAYGDHPVPIGHGATISAPHVHCMALEYLQDNLKPGCSALDVGCGSGYLVACMAQMVAAPQNSSSSASSSSSSSSSKISTSSSAAAGAGESVEGKDKDGDSSSSSSGGSAGKQQQQQQQATGKVVGIEHIQELADLSIANLKEDPNARGFLKDGTITIVKGDGRQGYAKAGPYDAIHVGAAAPQIPKALCEQLKTGGKMIIPVGPDGGDQYLCLVEKTSADQVTKRVICGVRYVPLTSEDHQKNKSLF